MCQVAEEKRVALVCLLMVVQLLKEGLTLSEFVLHVRQILKPQEHLRQETLEKLDTEPEHKALAHSLIYCEFSLEERVCSLQQIDKWDIRRSPYLQATAYVLSQEVKTLHGFLPVSKRYVTCTTVCGLMGDGLLDIAVESGKWQKIDVR